MTVERINASFADLIKAIEDLEQAEKAEARADCDDFEGCEPECELDEIESVFTEYANRLFVLLAEAKENHDCPFLLKRARSYGRKLITIIKRLTEA